MKHELLTVTEVASRLKCHPHTVRRWIWGRRLRAVKIGDLVRVPEQEVARLMKPAISKKAPRGIHYARKGVRALIETMITLRAKVPSRDVQQMERMIAAAQRSADWSNPLD